MERVAAGARAAPDPRSLGIDLTITLLVTASRLALFGESGIFSALPAWAVAAAHLLCVFAVARYLGSMASESSPDGFPGRVRRVLAGFAAAGLLVFPAGILLGQNRLPAYFGLASGDAVEFVLASLAALYGFLSSGLDPLARTRDSVAFLRRRDAKPAADGRVSEAISLAWSLPSFLIVLAGVYSVGEERDILGFAVLGFFAFTAILPPVAWRLAGMGRFLPRSPRAFARLADGILVGIGISLWNGIVLSGSEAQPFLLLLASGIIPARLLGIVNSSPRRLRFWTGLLSIAALVWSAFFR